MSLIDPEEFDFCEWQALSGVHWVFGHKIRGFVRSVVATVTQQPDADLHGRRWRYDVLEGERIGRTVWLHEAIEEVEKILQESTSGLKTGS